MTEPAAKGMAIRKTVLGQAHVDRAEAAKSAFDAPFQALITDHAEHQSVKGRKYRLLIISRPQLAEGIKIIEGIAEIQARS